MLEILKSLFRTEIDDYYLHIYKNLTSQFTFIYVFFHIT